MWTGGENGRQMNILVAVFFFAIGTDYIWVGFSVPPGWLWVMDPFVAIGTTVFSGALIGIKTDKVNMIMALYSLRSGRLTITMDRFR